MIRTSAVRVRQVEHADNQESNDHSTPVALRTFPQITGMGFSSTSGVVNVRFACPKGFVETEGRIVSDTEVSFLTPSFEKFGPMQVRRARYAQEAFYP